jgi:hypothetical protein
MLHLRWDVYIIMRWFCSRSKRLKETTAFIGWLWIVDPFGQKFEWEPLEHAAGGHGTRPFQITHTGWTSSCRTNRNGSVVGGEINVFKCFHLMMLGIEALI